MHIPDSLVAEFDKLSSDELRFFAKLFLKEAKLKAQEENRIKATTFQRGDLVYFYFKSEKRLAVILKVTGQKVNLLTGEGGRWDIPPKNLKHEDRPSEETISLFERLVGPLSQFSDSIGVHDQKIPSNHFDRQQFASSNLNLTSKEAGLRDFT